MRRRHLCCLLFLLVLVASCGKKRDAETASILSGQIIVGSLDWKEVGDLSNQHPISDWAQAVANIDIPALGSRCTGFLISEDVLMTNEHCIPSSSYARGVSVTFEHVKGIAKADQQRIDCDEFIGNSSALDYALLRCEGSPGSVYGFVTLDEESYAVGEGITIIQQNCDYYSMASCDPTKKYSQGKITKHDDEYSHNADTLGGSSGSPVFRTASGKVFAIHHAGLGNDGRGRGVENYAVPMARIVPELKRRFPTLFDGADEPPVASDKVGDSVATAYKLAKKTEKINEAIQMAGDVDFYELQLKAGASVSVVVSFKNSMGDLDVAVIDSQGKTITKSETTGDQESVRFAGEGTYYVIVYGYKEAVGDYTLSLAVEAGEGATLEDGANDSLASASLFALPAQGEGLEIDQASDVDYYAFELAAGESFEVSLLLDHAQGDLDLYLLDENAKVLAKSESTTNTERTSFKAQSGGKYFALVKGYRGARGTYKLSAQKL